MSTHTHTQNQINRHPSNPVRVYVPNLVLYNPTYHLSLTNLPPPTHTYYPPWQSYIKAKTYIIQWTFNLHPVPAPALNPFSYLRDGNTLNRVMSVLFSLKSPLHPWPTCSARVSLGQRWAWLSTFLFWWVGYLSWIYFLLISAVKRRRGCLSWVIGVWYIVAVFGWTINEGYV